MERPSERPADAAKDFHRPGASRTAAFVLLLGVGLAAGLVSGLLMHVVGEPFGVPAELSAGIGAGGPSPDRLPALNAAQAAAEQRNAALALATAGKILGLSLAVAVAVLRKSLRGAVLGALAGVVFGGLFGAAAGYVGLVTNSRLLEAGSLDRSHVSIAVHAVAWSIVALGVGAACTVAAGSARSALRYLPATFAAGLLAGLLYFPLVAVLIPAEDTNIVIPESLVAQMLWTTVPGVLMGLTVARAWSRAAD